MSENDAGHPEPPRPRSPAGTRCGRGRLTKQDARGGAYDSSRAIGDADRLGAIQVRAWQATYRGVMPDAYLDELDADDRAAYWRRQVLALLPGQRLEVIVDDGVVVGFAAAGPEHDGRAAGVGELYAINLDPQVWGRGLGRALLAT